MLLDPHDYVDRMLLFQPQLYEAVEVGFVEEQLRPGDVFVDVGSHIGLYSLVASRAVGVAGRVIAVDADSGALQRLERNLRLNATVNVELFYCGVSDQRGPFPFYRQDGGTLNSGANTLLPEPGAPDKWLKTCDVPCMTLLDLLALARVESVAGLKLDIERAEYRVLKRFLDEAPAPLRPSFILLEEYESAIGIAGGSAVELLESSGCYRHVRTVGTLERDHIFELVSALS